VGFTRNIDRDRAILGGLLNRLGLPSIVLSLLFAHAEAVRGATARLGLISPGDADQVVPRHTADSLLFALVRSPRLGERWLDVGSGAGFPGVVLACCYPECSFTLLEPHKRRAGFLELMTSDLGLGNLVVDGRRLEELTSADFDVAVARAFTDPGNALRELIGAVRRGGEAIVAVGPGTAVSPHARIVAVEAPGDVDSPGLFSMMTRKA
jgi:16S rRNA (guanine(527)-N(7))-methyltransferase RsmG